MWAITGLHPGWVSPGLGFFMTLILKNHQGSSMAVILVSPHLLHLVPPFLCLSIVISDTLSVTFLGKSWCGKRQGLGLLQLCQEAMIQHSSLCELVSSPSQIMGTEFHGTLSATSQIQHWPGLVTPARIRCGRERVTRWSNDPIYYVLKWSWLGVGIFLLTLSLWVLLLWTSLTKSPIQHCCLPTSS